MSEKQTSTESSHDEQTTKDSEGELKQDPSELPPYNDDDEMSKKQTSTQSSHDEQTTKDSGEELMQAVLQKEEDNTKREILASLSDTTLEDLPMELIVRILVKAVAMEVKGMRLVKRLWKEKADLVISRLRTVSLQWSSVLAIDFFRNELHRTLDGFAQDTLRWEVVLHQPSIRSYSLLSTTLRDEVFGVFIWPGRPCVLNVYDRSNMTRPKDTIPTLGFEIQDMAACSVSNCVYLLNEDSLGLSVIRIWKDEHKYKVSTWIKELMLPKPMSDWCSSGLSVSAQGNLVIISKQESPTPSVVGIYDANGLMQHKIILSPDTYGTMFISNVIQKADGNLVLAFCDSCIAQAKLLEIDTSGRIIHKYQAEHAGARVECFEDIYGRILVSYSNFRIELLDSEFNLLDTAVPQLDDGQHLDLFNLTYNGDRHDMSGFRNYYDGRDICVLATLRLTEG